ncbi:MAG: TRAP transporter small permease [Deltaproteobacteria bacterium]|nr:MAG: TRAP transporter small permease [Deltaproteobacteria bacterium]
MKFEQIVSVLDEITGKLDRALSLFTILLLGIIAVVVNLAVFYRHVLSAGLPWSEEVPKLGMVWMGFIGTSMALRREQHIGFYALINRLPAKMQTIFKLIGHFLVLFFLIILIKWGFFLAFTVGSSSVSPEMNISYLWLLLIVPIAGIFMALQLFMKILKSIVDLVGTP